MPITNDIKKRHSEIQMLFAEDKMLEAIKQLEAFARDFSKNDSDALDEVIVISSSFAQLEKAERNGVIDYCEIDQKRAKLLFQALDLLERLIN
ncbi:MAG: hypothetical protein D3908_04055 [Candidatus Electrothrix sp. AUS4]|nr:hypothetical protein [Candidatus Electrothrix sp. AUS4]